MVVWFYWQNIYLKKREIIGYINSHSELYIVKFYFLGKHWDAVIIANNRRASIEYVIKKR